MGGKQREAYAPFLPKVKDGAFPKLTEQEPRSGRGPMIQEQEEKEEVCPAVLRGPGSRPTSSHRFRFFFVSV